MEIGPRGMTEEDDPNDTALIGGSEAVRAEFDTISDSNVVSLRKAKGFIFQGDAPLLPPPMLVKGLLPFDGLAFIGGQSGAGKTFVAVDLAVSLTTQTAFFDRKVGERVGVVIVAGEGRGMLAARVEAARRHRASHENKIPLAWEEGVPELMTDADIKKFAARLSIVGQKFRDCHGVRLGAVIIDTVVSTFDLDDEDHNSEVARTIRKMRELGKSCSALIIPVHHYGKNAATGLRGGSSWRAGADAVISVLADRDDTTGQVKNHRLALAKARDGIEGPIAPFGLCWVELGVDEDGESFGTCVVEPSFGQSQVSLVATKKVREGAAVKTFREALVETLDTSGSQIRVLHDGPLVRAARVSDVRALFNRRYVTGEEDHAKRIDAVRMAFGRGLKGLLGELGRQTIGDVEWLWWLKS
jgi:AAA domain-containing protein